MNKIVTRTTPAAERLTQLYPRLRKVAVTVWVPDHDPDDLAQTAACGLWQRALKNPNYFASYSDDGLIYHAIQMMLNLRRAATRYRRTIESVGESALSPSKGDEPDPQPQEDYFIDPTPSPEQILISRQLRRDVRAAVYA